MIIPDPGEKRRDYEEQVVRTFYLSNVSIPQGLDGNQHGAEAIAGPEAHPAGELAECHYIRGHAG